MRRDGNALVFLAMLRMLLACNADQAAIGGPAPGPQDAATDRSTDASHAAAVDASPSVKPQNDAAVAAPGSAGVDAGIDAAPDAPTDGGVVDSGRPDHTAPAVLVEHVVATQVVDHNATLDLADQFAYVDQRVPSLKQLVVYLGYSRSTPSTHKAMLQFIASLGYRVISPQYRNDVSLMDPCYKGSSTNADCFYNARLEVFEGVDHSADIDVKPADSIEVRVARFLTYLDATFPNEGWGQYVDAGTGKPTWSDIIVAGHSQGAASTGLITKVRSVYRAVMFAGPDDNNMKTKVAVTWPAKAPVTPLSNIYAFVNQKDLNYSFDAANWKAMGLGTGQPVDGQSPPYASAHLLTSTLAYPSSLGGNGAHLMLAAPATPLGSDGKYVYAPVWRYLFGVSP